MKRYLWILFLLLATPVWASLPPTRILDEGTDQGVAFKFNCVGAGIVCSQSGITGTLTVAGSGSSTFTGQHDDSTISTAVDTLDILTGLNAGILPAGEMNVYVDESAVNHDNLSGFVAAEHVDWTGVDFLVGTATGLTANEIVAGTAPAGELGGTWASPTVDSGIHDDEYVELGDSFVGDVTGAYNATVVGNDSHAHTGGTLSGIDMANDVMPFTSDTLAGRLTNETGTGSFVRQNSATMTGLTVNTVTLSGASVLANATASGVLTLGGTGGSYNENLTLDFESIANKVQFETGTGAEISIRMQAEVNDDTEFQIGRDASDSALIWESTGNDNLQLGLGVGNATYSGYFSLMEYADLGNANRSPSGTSADPVLRVYSSDEGQAGDYIEMYHNQTDSVIVSGGGGLGLKTPQDFRIYDTTSDTQMVGFTVNDNQDENRLFVDDDGGNMLVLTNQGNKGKDHDHAPQTNPTLFIHSDKDPDTANDEWISLTHDVTNGVIDVGSGVVSIPDGITSTGTIEGATLTEGGVAVYNDDEMDTKAELEGILTDVADIAEADGDTWTGVHDFGGATSIEIVNANADLSLDAAGEIGYDEADDALGVYDGQSGELSAVEAQISFIRHWSAAFDPAGYYDQESTYRVLPIMTVGDDAPNGITLLEWEVDYVGGDPTTELDADIMCDTTPDYNPAAGATVMDVIDTTNGASAADTGFDSGTCANASKMYIRFGGDPTDANVVIAVDIYFYNEED